MSDMKILIVANSSIGLVKFRGELIQKLQENHDVYIATKFDKCIQELREISDNLIEIDMERRGTNLISEPQLYCKYVKVIKSLSPDFIITYTIKPNIYCGLISGRRSIPYVSNITGLGTAFQKEGMLKQYIIKLYKKALKRAKVVFFENDANKKVFVDYGIIKAENGHVLCGAGVNIQKFVLTEYPAGKSINFLFMGRLMKEKGVNELIEAVEKLRRVRDNFVLTVLGEYEENYHKKIKQLEEEGVVRYIGWAEDVKPYIAECMCTVLPSYHEGMSNTLLECAAMGRPIITSDIAGCRESLVDGKSGYLVNVRDSKDLFEKMNQFCELSYEERKAMGLESRKHIEKLFDKDKVVKETIKRMELG